MYNRKIRNTSDFIELLPDNMEFKDGQLRIDNIYYPTHKTERVEWHTDNSPAINIFRYINKDLNHPNDILSITRDVDFRIISGQPNINNLKEMYFEIEFRFNVYMGTPVSILYLIGSKGVIVNYPTLESKFIKYVDFTSMGDGIYINNTESCINSVSSTMEHQPKQYINNNISFIKSRFTLQKNHWREDHWSDQGTLYHVFIKDKFCGSFGSVYRAEINSNDGIKDIIYFTYKNKIEAIAIDGGQSVQVANVDTDINGCYIDTLDYKPFQHITKEHIYFKGDTVFSLKNSRKY